MVLGFFPASLRFPGSDGANGGGGGHAGHGGSGCNRTATGGASHDSVHKPSHYGGGGSLGAHGGGVVWLTAFAVVVNGSLTSDGESATGVNTAGGGAGGSVFVDVQSGEIRYVRVFARARLALSLRCSAGAALSPRWAARARWAAAVAAAASST